MSNQGLLVWQEDRVISWSQLLLSSYQYWLKQPLLDVNGTPEQVAKELFEASFILVSHGTEADPIFNYGNQKALDLWELSWEEFTQMPSRKTAEAMVQEERDRLLAETTNKGFVEGFSGVRISRTGKRFRIEEGIIWNVIDADHNYCGQAAVYSKVFFL